MRLLSVKGASGAHSAYVRLVPACHACLDLQIFNKSKAASVVRLCQVCVKALPHRIRQARAVHNGLEAIKHKAGFSSCAEAAPCCPVAGECTNGHYSNRLWCIKNSCHTRPDRWTTGETAPYANGHSHCLSPKAAVTTAACSCDSWCWPCWLAARACPKCPSMLVSKKGSTLGTHAVKADRRCRLLSASMSSLY